VDTDQPVDEASQRASQAWAARRSAVDTTFEVGASVVYPAHGVAEVRGREKRTIGGETLTYVVLTVAGEIRSDDLTVLVLEDRLEELGVRPAMSVGEAADVLEVLAERNPRLSSNWSRRFKSHQQKLRSGDVFECAEVVRNLALRQRDKPLAAAEKAMYRRARIGLISELAVTWGVSTEDAATRVDSALEPDRA
jgi:CarD family transcriptional regulator